MLYNPAILRYKEDIVPPVIWSRYVGGSDCTTGVGGPTLPGGIYSSCASGISQYAWIKLMFGIDTQIVTGADITIDFGKVMGGAELAALDLMYTSNYDQTGFLGPSHASSWIYVTGLPLSASKVVNGNKVTFTLNATGIAYFHNNSTSRGLYSDIGYPSCFESKYLGVTYVSQGTVALVLGYWPCGTSGFSCNTIDISNSEIALT